MTDQSFLYLSYSDVVSLDVGMKDIIDALDIAFREHGHGRVEMPPKPGVHTQPDAFIHAMPAYIPALHSAGMKWVSGYPDNYVRGLPYISGLLILNDEITGVPISVMDCTWITAMRTAGATAIAARYLARPDSESVGILGCGVQGRSNLAALSVLFPIKHVVAYDTLPEQIERFAGEMQEQLGVSVVRAKRPRDAVDGLDIVVTAGPILHQPHGTIKAGWMKEGAFASLVDFDSYWDGAAMKETAKFCTDDVPQFEYYRSQGYFQNTPPIYATVSELTAGVKRGRENEHERTMTCNLGIALEDMATAPLIYKRAVERNVGIRLPL
jgi:ornithine cyclodeaminase/alanine dehydrogenase